MYSKAEIESIFKNVRTGEEWDLVCNLFAWLFSDSETRKHYNDDRQTHFSDTALKSLYQLDENGKA